MKAKKQRKIKDLVERAARREQGGRSPSSVPKRPKLGAFK
jgi:hypothetical protein